MDRCEGPPVGYPSLPPLPQRTQRHAHWVLNALFGPSDGGSERFRAAKAFFSAAGFRPRTAHNQRPPFPGRESSNLGGKQAEVSVVEVCEPPHARAVQYLNPAVAPYGETPPPQLLQGAIDMNGCEADAVGKLLLGEAQAETAIICKADDLQPGVNLAKQVRYAPESVLPRKSVKPLSLDGPIDRHLQPQRSPQMRVAFEDVAKPGMRNGGRDAIADRHNPVAGLLQDQAGPGNPPPG